MNSRLACMRPITLLAMIGAALACTQTNAALTADDEAALDKMRNAVANATTLRFSERQHAVTGFCEHADAVIPTLTDSKEMLDIVGEIKVAGMEGLVTLLEVWGDHETFRTQLKPMTKAALMLTDRAAQLSRQEADKAQKQRDQQAFDKWDSQADLAGWVRANLVYYACLAENPNYPDPNLPQGSNRMLRTTMAVPASDYLKRFDNADSGAQATVRLSTSRLLLVAGNCKRARDVLLTIINSGASLKPIPTPYDMNMARFLIVNCDISCDDLASAKRDKAAWDKWRTDTFPAALAQAKVPKELADKTLESVGVTSQIMGWRVCRLEARHARDFAAANQATGILADLRKKYPYLAGTIDMYDPLKNMRIIDDGGSGVIDAGPLIDPAKK